MSSRFGGLLLIAVGVLLLVLCAVTPGGGTWGWGNTGWGGPHIWAPWPWGGGWLVGFALTIAIIWLITPRGRSNHAPTTEARHAARSAAVEYARWRYAAREITREQYDEMLRVLDSKQT